MRCSNCWWHRGLPTIRGKFAFGAPNLFKIAITYQLARTIHGLMISSSSCAIGRPKLCVGWLEMFPVSHKHVLMRWTYTHLKKTRWPFPIRSWGACSLAGKLLGMRNRPLRSNRFSSPARTNTGHALLLGSVDRLPTYASSWDNMPLNILSWAVGYPRWLWVYISSQRLLIS